MTEQRASAAAQAVESRLFQMLASLQLAANERRVNINGYVGKHALRHIAMWLSDLKPCRSLKAGLLEDERLEDTLPLGKGTRRDLASPCRAEYTPPVGVASR